MTFRTCASDCWCPNCNDEAASLIAMTDEEHSRWLSARDAELRINVVHDDDYAAPDPYQLGLEAMRAAAETTFEAEYKAARQREFDAEYRRAAAETQFIIETSPLPPLTAAERAEYRAPNPYDIALAQRFALERRKKES